jgi:hypothetical protein
MEENKKMEIYGALANGRTVKEIQADYDISYASALRLSNQFKAAVDEGTVDKLIDMDTAIWQQIKDTVTAPDELIEKANGTLDQLSKDVQGLQRLDIELQNTASAVNRRLFNMVQSAKQPSELETITACLCRIRDSFFNQKGVQVNIQNNVGGEAYGDLLNDVPSKTVN